VAVEDDAARRRNHLGAQPVAFGPQLIAARVEDLKTQQLDAEHGEEHDADQPHHDQPAVAAADLIFLGLAAHLPRPPAPLALEEPHRPLRESPRHPRRARPWSILTHPARYATPTPGHGRTAIWRSPPARRPLVFPLKGEGFDPGASALVTGCGRPLPGRIAACAAPGLSLP